MINLAEKIKGIKILDQFDLDNKKIILIVLASVVVFYVDINFIFRPQIRGLGRSSAEATRLKKDLANFRTDFKKMQELKSKEALSPSKSGLRAKKIVAENEFSTLLQDISKIANNNEVKILQLKPSREGQTSNESKRLKAFGKAEPFLITLDLTCGYHNLGKFINGLENLPALVKVQDIRIEAQEKDYLNQRARVILVTYVKK